PQPAEEGRVKEVRRGVVPLGRRAFVGVRLRAVRARVRRAFNDLSPVNDRFAVSIRIDDAEARLRRPRSRRDPPGITNLPTPLGIERRTVERELDLLHRTTAQQVPYRPDRDAFEGPGVVA